MPNLQKSIVPNEVLEGALPGLVVDELGRALHRLVRVVICRKKERERDTMIR